MISNSYGKSVGFLEAYSFSTRGIQSPSIFRILVLRARTVGHLKWTAQNASKNSVSMYVDQIQISNLRASASDERHDPGSAVGVRGLEQSHGDGEGDARGSQGPVALLHRPGVALQLPQEVRQAHVAGGNGLQEPGEGCRIY